MLQFLFLILDVVIVVAFIAGPWIYLTKLNVQWPNWLKDGIVGVIAFVIWAGIALYLATQTIIWLGLVPEGVFPGQQACEDTEGLRASKIEGCGHLLLINLA